MKHWRESKSLSVVHKENKYHCASGGRNLDAMMSHTKDVRINEKCPLHLECYLHLAHLYNNPWDAKLSATVMNSTNKNKT